MYLTGFADEAADGIEGQIQASKALGWRHIEARNIDGINIHDLPEKAFDAVCGKLADAGIEINCFGSAIANWAKSIKAPPGPSIEEARRAVHRMKRLGTKLIRIMSFAILEGRSPEDQLKEERFQRLRELTKMFLDEGLTPLHENCMNYGGMGPAYTLELLENVPGLELVFDTGNPVVSEDRTKAPPYPRQSSWEFYSQVKKHVAYVHIKDAVWDEKEKRARFTYPGEGDGDVGRIVKDLLDSGYDGGLSIEPHLATVLHDDSVRSPEETRYAGYIEYGRRMIRILDELKSNP